MKAQSGLFLFFFIALLWAGSFIAIKELVHEAEPLIGASLRVFFACITIGLFRLFKEKSFKGFLKKPSKGQFFAGLFLFGLPFWCLFTAEQYVSPGIAGIINGTVPLWAMLISLFIPELKRLLNARLLAALIIGFSGLMILNVESIFSPSTASDPWGLFLLCLMALFYGAGTCINTFLLKDPKHSSKPLENLFLQLISGLAFLLLVTPWNKKDLLHIAQDPNCLFSVFYLSVCSTSLAFIFFFRLIKLWGPVKTSLLTFLTPFFTCLLDYLFYKNIPSFYSTAGALIILSSIFILKTHSKEAQT